VGRGGSWLAVNRQCRALRRGFWAVDPRDYRRLRGTPGTFLVALGIGEQMSHAWRHRYRGNVRPEWRPFFAIATGIFGGIIAAAVGFDAVRCVVASLLIGMMLKAAIWFTPLGPWLGGGDER
jgi:hypothetical protein